MLNTDQIWSGSESISFANTDADKVTGSKAPSHSRVRVCHRPLNDLTTIGGYDPTMSIFYLRNSNNDGDADLSVRTDRPGAAGSPLIGDWNGDGVDHDRPVQPGHLDVLPEKQQYRGLCRR